MEENEIRDKYASPKQVSDLLRVTEGTLAVWRSKGYMRGPEWGIVAGRVWYPWDKLLAYKDSEYERSRRELASRGRV